MEAVVANLAEPGTRALAVVTGYFGDRLAAMLARYGADVERVNVRVGPRGRSRGGGARRSRAPGPFDLVAIVHAETSTGVRNPGRGRGPHRARARRARDRRRGDVARRDAARRRRVGARRVLLVLAERTRRAVGARAGHVLAARARSPRRAAAASTSISRCSRTTGCAASITTRSRRRSSTRCATALAEVEEEGLEARWARHERVHHALVRCARRASD